MTLSAAAQRLIDALAPLPPPPPPARETPTPTSGTPPAAQATPNQLTPAQSQMLRETLAAMPRVEDRINAAVANGNLLGFELLGEDANRGGGYMPSTRNMSFSPRLFQDPSDNNISGRAELAYQIGHELQHAENRALSVTSQNTFSDTANQVRSGTGVRDYTASLNAVLATHRRDESMGHISGHNAMVEYMQTTLTQAQAAQTAQTTQVVVPTWDELFAAREYRMSELVERTPPANGAPATYAPKQGVTINADRTITMNDANIEAASVHYHDAPGTHSRLGANASSDYRNDFGTQYVQWLAQREVRDRQTLPESVVRMDLESLNLTEQQIERNGFNLGRAGEILPYIDGPNNRFGLLDHTLPGQNENNAQLINAIEAQLPDVMRAHAAGEGMVYSRHERRDGNLVAIQETPPATTQDIESTPLALTTAYSRAIGLLVAQAQAPTATPQTTAPAAPAAPTTAVAANPSALGDNGTSSAGMHPLVQQSMEALNRSPNLGAAVAPADRERVAAGIAAHAAMHGITPDHVVLNTQRTDLIAVQGTLGDPAARHSPPLPVSEASRTDVAVARQQLEQSQVTPPVASPAQAPEPANQGVPMLAR